MPDEMWVKMKYHTTVRFQSASEPKVDQVFSGNSPYDPDITYIGKQPTGYDQWAGFYSKFYVAACKIRMKLYNLQANLPAIVTIVPAVTTSPYTGIEYGENPLGRSVMMGTRDGQGRTKLSYYMTTNKIFGRRGTDIADAFIGALSATGGNSPSQQWSFLIRGENPINLETSVDIYADVMLTYYVKVFSRRLLPTS